MSSMANLRSIMKLANMTPKTRRKELASGYHSIWLKNLNAVNPVGNSSSRLPAVARFAVKDYNRRNKKKLELEQVLEAKDQAVAGSMFFLTLKVKDTNEDGKHKTLKAQVWDKPPKYSPVKMSCQSSRLLPFYPVNASSVATGGKQL